MTLKIFRFLRHSTIAAFSCTLAMSAWAGDGAQPAIYLGLHGGMNDLSDWDATVGLGAGVSLPGTVHLDNGTHFGVFGGRQTENARLEVEYQAGRADIRAIELGPVRQDLATHGSYRAFTFNAYRTHAISGQLTGFAGLGLGWGSVSMPRMGFTNPPCNCFAEASASGVAWLGRLGLEYRLGAAGHVFGQFTLLGLPKPSAGGTPGVEYGSQTVRSLTLGYRHTF